MANNNNKTQKEYRKQSELTLNTYHLAQFLEIIPNGNKGGFRMRFFVYDNNKQIADSFATNTVYQTKEYIKKMFFEDKDPDLQTQKKFLVELSLVPTTGKRTIIGFKKANQSTPLPEWTSRYMDEWQQSTNGSFKMSSIKKEYLKNRKLKNKRVSMLEKLRELQDKWIKDKLGDEYNTLFGTREEREVFLEKVNKFLKRNNLSWKDRGTRWSIDHREPVADVDLTSKESIMKCFHVSNLQPLFHHENVSKWCYSVPEFSDPNKVKVILEDVLS